MIESMVFLLLIIGTVIGAIGGFIGAAAVFFPTKVLVWLLEEVDESDNENVIEYPQGS